MDIRPVEICTLVWWVQISNFFGSTFCVFVRCRKGERMVSTCMVPNVKHGGGGVVAWSCFAGDTVEDLFKIEGTLNQHGYHSILQPHAIPSRFFVGPSFIFQQDNDPKSGLFDQQGEWWRAAPDDLASTVTWPKPNRDGLGWNGSQSESKRANKCSASLRTPSRLLENHFRWLPHEAHRANA